MLNFIVTGAASGLGREICNALYVNGKNVLGVDRNNIDDSVGWPSTVADITDKDEVEEIWDDFQMVFDHARLDCLINCAGVNFISPFEDISEEDFDRVMSTNVKSILFMSQAFLPELKCSKGTILNVISNASHMPMTHSFSYNASKGAAEIATRQMARELTKLWGVTVFGVSPNKLSGTKMSQYIDTTFPAMRGMTPEEGRAYQLKGLLTGKETNPKDVAKLIAFLLNQKSNHEYLSGCILPLGL